MSCVLACEHSFKERCDPDDDILLHGRDYIKREMLPCVYWFILSCLTFSFLTFIIYIEHWLEY